MNCYIKKLRPDARIPDKAHFSDTGYDLVYPSIFGEHSGSELANAMDINIANGFYHYDDPTCDYSCLITEYFYWSLTSVLGAQKDRCSEIDNEWELCTKELVQENDPAIYDLLTNEAYNLPSILPTGNYS